MVEIAELTDVDTAWKLVNHFGGLNFYFPVEIKAEHKLAQAIGLEAAKKICSVFGGSYNEVPMMSAAQSKKQLIAKMQGKSTREIARNLKCTERYVRKIKDKKVDENQKSLFE